MYVIRCLDVVGVVVWDIIWAWSVCEWRIVDVAGKINVFLGLVNS